MQLPFIHLFCVCSFVIHFLREMVFLAVGGDTGKV